MQLFELQAQYQAILREKNEKILNLIRLAMNEGMSVDIVCTSRTESERWNTFMTDYFPPEFKSHWQVVSVVNKTDESHLRVNAGDL